MGNRFEKSVQIVSIVELWNVLTRKKKNFSPWSLLGNLEQFYVWINDRIDRINDRQTNRRIEWDGSINRSIIINCRSSRFRPDFQLGRDRLKGGRWKIPSFTRGWSDRPLFFITRRSSLRGSFISPTLGDGTLPNVRICALFRRVRTTEYPL